MKIIQKIKKVFMNKYICGFEKNPQIIMLYKQLE